MPRLGSAAGVLLLTIGLAGCGSPNAPTPIPSVQGHWLGAITSAADGIGTIALDLTQAGAVVTGSALLSQPGLPDARGAVTGTVASQGNATTLKYSVFYDYGDGCTGTYGGTLSLSAAVLSGPYVGQNCAHTFAGSIRVDKAQ